MQETSVFRRELEDLEDLVAKAYITTYSPALVDLPLRGQLGLNEGGISSSRSH